MGFSEVGGVDAMGGVPEFRRRRRRRRSFSADIWSFVAGLGASEDWGLFLEEGAFGFWLGFCFCFFGGIFGGRSGGMSYCPALEERERPVRKYARGSAMPI